MALKSPQIFSILILCLIPIPAFAYTDEQITQMYRGQNDNQTLDNIDSALQTGALHCSDLPPNLIMGFCHQDNSTITVSQIMAANQQTPQSSSDHGVGGIIPILAIMIAGMVALPIIIIILQVREEEHDYRDTRHSGPKRSHKILLSMGLVKHVSKDVIPKDKKCIADGCKANPIIKVKAPDGDDYYCKKHHDYMVEQGAITDEPNSCGVLVKDPTTGKIQNPKALKPHQNFLVSLGILKVKKNA